MSEPENGTAKGDARGSEGQLGAIDKAFRLLRAFGPDDAHGAGVSELARRAGLSKSTTFRILATLIDNEAVQKAGERYRLVPAVDLRAPERPSARLELVSETLTPFLAALFERTRHTVHLAYLDGADTVYANKLFSVTGVDAPSRIGGRVPGYTTGVGKAIMAFDPDAIEAAIAQGLSPWTEHSIAAPETLRSELAVVRRSGFAYDVDEVALGLSCVAAPVWGLGPVPVAAMSVSGPSGIFRPQEHEGALAKICATAGRALKRRQRELENDAQVGG